MASPDRGGNDEPIETAMVLAAGLGKRMRPMTADTPKPLVPVLGRTLLDRVLDRLAGGGVKRAVVNVHYMGDQVIEALANRDEPAIEISDERDALLDTGGGVHRALPLLGQSPFFIHNADSIWVEGPQCVLQQMRDAWDETQMDVLLLLAMTTSSTGYDGRGDFAMDSEGRVERPHEHGVVPFVFAGVSIAHPRLFDGAPEAPFSMNALWTRAIDNGRAFGLRLEGQWMHVGSPLGLAEAENVLQTTD